MFACDRPEWTKLTAMDPAHDIPCPVCAKNILDGYPSMTPEQQRDVRLGYCPRCAVFRATVPDTEWSTVERTMIITQLGTDFHLQLAQALVYRWRTATGPLRESITCPRCGITSHNFNDVREGYCGSCHDWTSCVDYRAWTPAEAIRVKDTLGPNFDAKLAERLVFRWRANRF